MKHAFLKAIAIGAGIGFIKALLNETVFKERREREAAEEAKIKKEMDDFAKSLVNEAFPAPDFLADLSIDDATDFEDLEL